MEKNVLFFFFKLLNIFGNLPYILRPTSSKVLNSLQKNRKKYIKSYKKHFSNFCLFEKFKKIFFKKKQARGLSRLSLRIS